MRGSAVRRRSRPGPGPAAVGRRPPTAAPGTPWTTRIATLLGLGHLPRVPGTWGTLGALVVWAPVRTAWPQFEWPLVVVATGIAVFTAGREARRLRGTDPSCVVVDEAAGMMLAMTALPWMPSLLQFAAAFLLFRLFDVVKPPPLRHLERLPGGWGIVADDLGAGLYSLLVLRWLFVS